ncbi:helix-turn-helix domain-containing protein [Roseateles sp. DC23W]|uniref:Helix-turn-helix domain-containing protein n=2 Tax=Pelomonas dachongensis TaxID=3299029 RepID=A0ABW7EG70_9BURK
MASASDWDEVVGLAVAVRRSKLGLTQLVLAQAAGIHRNYLADVERGQKSPTMGVVYALCVALDCSPEKLVKQAVGYLTDEEKRREAVEALPPRRPGRPKRAAAG